MYYSNSKSTTPNSRFTFIDKKHSTIAVHQRTVLIQLVRRIQIKQDDYQGY